MNLRAAVYTNDAQLYLLLRHILGQEGVIARLTTQSGDLIKLCQSGTIKLIIIDSSLPLSNTAQLCRSCKDVTDDIAIVLLSSGIEENSTHFEAPQIVDLNIASPFDPISIIQLIHNIRSDMPLSVEMPTEHKLMTYADVELDVTRIKVRRNGHYVSLTSLQFRLLQFLMMQPTVIHTRDELISAGWPSECEVEPRTVDIHIGHLRRSLSSHGPDIIRTVRGRGYAIDIDANHNG
ncbi:winged helix-turn-helix transcriptional regulator [Brucella pituitosa]|uniref:Response regulator transcription factor n=1 Tax=Brucella pituitosa TaxID=571256 RepID=A0ABS3K1X1_9HYPH|nr:response regulator transcription factor [Brucella pituitosa]MBO1040918.1 response regulator transcription factor [Brucella pituitosa]